MEAHATMRGHVFFKVLSTLDTRDILYIFLYFAARKCKDKSRLDKNRQIPQLSYYTYRLYSTNIK